MREQLLAARELAAGSRVQRLNAKLRETREKNATNLWNWRARLRRGLFTDAPGGAE